MADTSPPTTRDLVLVPAIITLGVTALRLIGELQHWSSTLFNRQGGGGGAIVGISWLPFLFGIYFAVRLARAGEGPASKGKAIGMTVLGLAILMASLFSARVLGASQIGVILTACFAALVGGLVASRGWAALGRTLLVYGLAARVPVAALMLPAIIGKWGTHYDALPPNWPAMGPVQTWLLVGLLPQLTLWIGLTLLCGMLVGSITGAVVGGRRREAVPTAA
jgi:hypothetical protein